MSIEEDIALVNMFKKKAGLGGLALLSGGASKAIGADNSASSAFANIINAIDQENKDKPYSWLGELTNDTPIFDRGGSFRIGNVDISKDVLSNDDFLSQLPPELLERIQELFSKKLKGDILNLRKDAEA